MFRRINKRKDITDQEGNIDTKEKSDNVSLQKKIFLPTRTPPLYKENIITKYKSTNPPTYPPIKEILKKTKVPTDKLKLYMNSLRDKLKTIYKGDKYRKFKTEKESLNYEEKNENLHRNLLKRRLNIDPVIDRTELLVSNRRLDLDEYEDKIEDVNNDIEYNDDLESLRDQIAQESMESGSVYKPLSKILAKTDDVIYKQMNFWRNQFESQRLLEFLRPANDSAEQEEARPRIETELIVGKPKVENKKRKVLKKFKDKNESVRKEFNPFLHIKLVCHFVE